MKDFKIALQLYSVRDEIEKDMDKALGDIKAMGYDYVEFAGYYGKTASEVKALLDKHRLICLSVHQPPSTLIEHGQDAVDFLKEIGVKYCAIPYYELNELQNNFDQVVELFTKVGKLLKENGIQMLYHNHDFEFHKIGDEYILDKLFAGVPADLMNPQIDTCWVRYAGLNPVDYVRKYKGRVSVIHFKDYVCANPDGAPVYELIGQEASPKEGSHADNGFEFRSLGDGVQDFPALLQVAEEVDACMLVVEQDMSTDRTPMESAQRSIDYLKRILGEGKPC